MATLVHELYSQNVWEGPFDGSQTVWNFTMAGGYISRSHVKAYYIDASDVRHDITLGDPNFLGTFQLSITPALSATTKRFVIYRDSSNGGVPLVNYGDGANISEVSLDQQAEQSVFVAAEAADVAALAEFAAAGAVVDGDTAIATANSALTAAGLASSTATAANTTAGNAIAIAEDAAADVAAALASAAAASAAATAAAATATAAAADAAAAAATAEALAESLVNPYSANGGPISGNVSIGGTLVVTGLTTMTGGAKVTEMDWPASGALRWRASRESDGTWQLRRYDSGGTIQDTPLSADDDTGKVTIKQPILGLAGGDALAINSNTASIPNGLSLTDGSLGVGVTPAAKLHSKSNGEAARFESTTVRGSGNSYVSFYDPTGVKGYYGYTGADDTLRVWNSLNADILFGVNGSERMRVLSSGTGVMTASPDAALGVSGDVRVHYNRTLYNSIFSGLQHQGDSGGTEFQSINSSVDYGFQWASGTSYAGRTVKMRLGTTGALVPGADGTQDMGSASLRWATAYASIVSDGAVSGGAMLSSSGAELRIGAGSGWTSVRLFPALIKDVNGNELGTKNVSRNTTAGGLDGQCTAVTAGFTLNTGLAAGTTRSFYNDSASAITITQGAGLTLYGAAAATGNRTLAARGMCTIWANSSTVYKIMGEVT